MHVFTKISHTFSFYTSNFTEHEIKLFNADSIYFKYFNILMKHQFCHLHESLGILIMKIT